MKRKHANISIRTLATVMAPAALLVACGASTAYTDAKTLNEANAIYVQGDKCTRGVTGALAEHKLGVTSDPEKADSTLALSITSEGRNLDGLPEFGGIGHRASYSATLTGHGDEVLFSTTGEEGSTTFEEMCEDIGDEIASRIKDRRSS